MAVLAAIDVGSNAIRLSIGRTGNDGKISAVESMREPIRLGRDVFTRRVISDQTMEEACDAFRGFKSAIDRNGVTWTRAVATSALREAMNRDTFIDRISQAASIEIEVIGPEEEARLIQLAVSEKVNLKNKTALLIDIGGGSTEVTLVVDGSIVSTESFRLGAVRLLQMLEEQKQGEKKFNVLVREYVDSAQRRLRRELGDRKIDICAGTGGNIDALIGLRKDMLMKERDSSIDVSELNVIVKKLSSTTFEDRVRELRLRPDRADVIVPAAIILQEIVKVAKVNEILIPKVGLKDGLMIDMGLEIFGTHKHTNRDQTVTSAIEVGRKYSFDEQHGLIVARYAVELFDQTKTLHNLNLEHRSLLEIASILHDVGTYISMTAHHKHTYYLLTATPVIGLSRAQMEIVANVARYHRKSFPKMQHEAYRLLSSKDRVVVSKLAAILRMADAMDNEHASKVSSFTTEYKKPNFTVRLEGEGDLLLEKWALMRKGDLFEEVFGVKVGVVE